MIQKQVAKPEEPASLPSEKIRRYRRELEDLKSRYQALAETASDVIIQVSQDLRIVYANSQVHGNFQNHSQKRLSAVPLRLFFHPENSGGLRIESAVIFCFPWQNGRNVG